MMWGLSRNGWKTDKRMTTEFVLQIEDVGRKESQPLHRKHPPYRNERFFMLLRPQAPLRNPVLNRRQRSWPVHQLKHNHLIPGPLLRNLYDFGWIENDSGTGLRWA